jgi:hypothetical protein
MKPLSQEDIEERFSYSGDSLADAVQHRDLVAKLVYIRNALAWAKSWKLSKTWQKCEQCLQLTTVYEKQHEDTLCKDCLLNRAFGVIDGGKD